LVNRRNVRNSSARENGPHRHRDHLPGRCHDGPGEIPGHEEFRSSRSRSAIRSVAPGVLSLAGWDARRVNEVQATLRASSSMFLRRWQERGDPLGRSGPVKVGLSALRPSMRIEIARAPASETAEKGQARLEDAKNACGHRKSSPWSAIEQARAALVLSEKNSLRQTDLPAHRGSRTQILTRARSTRDQTATGVLPTRGGFEDSALGFAERPCRGGVGQLRSLAGTWPSRCDLCKSGRARRSGLDFSIRSLDGRMGPCGLP